MWWKTAWLLRLLWRWGQAGSTLGIASHDAAKEVAGAMANGRGLWLRRPVMLRVLAGPAAGFEFTAEASILIFQPAIDV